MRRLYLEIALVVVAAAAILLYGCAERRAGSR